MTKSKSKTFPIRYQRQRQDEDQLQGELRKIKPPNFDGEKEGEDVESWLREMRKYLQLYNRSNNLEARITKETTKAG